MVLGVTDGVLYDVLNGVIKGVTDGVDIDDVIICVTDVSLAAS